MKKENVLKIINKITKSLLILIVIPIILLLILLIISSLNKHPLRGEVFSTPQEALSSYEEYEMEHVKNPLDNNAPYNYIDTIYIGDIGIIVYNKSDTFSKIFFEYIKKKDNHWIFIGGMAWLTVDSIGEDYWQEGAYNFDNIVINNKKYAICFSYLPLDSDYEIYVDGTKSEKQHITIPMREGSIDVNLCYALSTKTDSLLKNIKTPVKDRHKYELRLNQF